jgi:DNA polymerase-1
MYKRKSQVVLDIETNLAHNTIWMVGLYNPSLGRSTSCFTLEELYDQLSGVDEIIGHNLIGFDLKVLRNVWGFDWNRGVVDTLILGRLLDPAIGGGHSLRAWAERAGGSLKEDFDPADFDLGLTPKMEQYCHADCKANWDVYEYMEAYREKLKFSEDSVQLEHDVATYTSIQETNGFAFKFDEACKLHNSHSERMQEIEHELQEVFPPIVEQRWSEKTGKPLKDKVTVFNPGSRQQVASRLESKGAVWTEFTETGKPKVDETTLKEQSHIPESLLVLEYLILSKRLGMVRSWLDAVGDDGRIHGRVNTIGAITGRMSHSKPNMAQIPSAPEYRTLFTVAEGNQLVGIDASGLELRMLAHYMNDTEYTDLILNGDIHTYNQEAAGLPTRDNAKTFIYAFLYGAGDGKIGSITGGGAAEGAKLKSKFLQSLPALKRLLSQVGMASRSGTLPGLDGRRVHVRHEHAALNTLLQSAGAIVMKKALVIAIAKLESYGYPYKLVAQVHDEFQVEVPEEYAQRVGVVFRNAIRDAGRELKLRCPLDGEHKIGSSWADTH